MEKLKRVPRGASNADRIKHRSRPDDNGCWIWIGLLDADGYGTVCPLERRNKKAHRVSYEAFVGPIPEELTIDHLCRVRNCVNPAHLEPVTRQVNSLRGNTIAAQEAATTHCPADHPYSPENTYITPKTGSRNCRQCHRKQSAEWSRRKRLGLATPTRRPLRLTSAH